MRRSPDNIIFDSWAFKNFALADEQFAKALQILETCVSINYDWCGKLVPSLESPITFDERFKVTSVTLFYSWFWFIKLRIRQFYIW